MKNNEEVKAKPKERAYKKATVLPNLDYYPSIDDKEQTKERKIDYRNTDSVDLLINASSLSDLPDLNNSRSKNMNSSSSHNAIHNNVPFNADNMYA